MILESVNIFVYVLFAAIYQMFILPEPCCAGCTCIDQADPLYCVRKHEVGSALVGSPDGHGGRELSAVVRIYLGIRYIKIIATCAKNL